MAGDIFVVAFDGLDRKVVDVAVGRARKEGAALHIVHVLEWSPYTFLTQEELAERHALRQQELAKANVLTLGPALDAVRRSGLEATGEVRHGNVVDVVCTIAAERQAALIFVGRSNALSARVFGSVASGLAQCAPIPTVIVP